MKLVARRLPARPKTTSFGIQERIDRYRLSEWCAEFTPEVIAFWAKVLRNEPVPVVVNGEVLRNKKGKVVMSPRYTPEHVFMATDRLMERAFGRPVTVAEVNENIREQSVRKVEVRWLPPDPADTSKHIPQEPD